MVWTRWKSASAVPAATTGSLWIGRFSAASCSPPRRQRAEQASGCRPRVLGRGSARSRGGRSDHAFKPEWNPALLRSQNYVRGLCGFRLDHARMVGGFRKRSGSDQDWGVYLRLTADTRRPVVHVPHVLAHRLARRGWSCSALELARAALAVTPNAGSASRSGSRCPRRPRAAGAPPAVRLVVATGLAHAAWGPASRASSVTPSTRDFRCLSWSTSDHGRSRELRDGRARHARSTGRRGRYPYREFSYAWVQNWAVSGSGGEPLCLVNDDVWVSSLDGSSSWSVTFSRTAWARSARGCSIRTVRSARRRDPRPGWGCSAVSQRARHSGPGYLGRAVLDQDLSCVTAGCMVSAARPTLKVGGMDRASRSRSTTSTLHPVAPGRLADRARRGRRALSRGVQVGGATDSAARRDNFAAEQKRMEGRWGRACGRPALQPESRIDCTRRTRFPAS